MKSICKAFAVLCLLFPLTAWAQTPEQIYTIKKGDTLWGISEKFIKDPYYWPNLWANNPYITNPHFIYPGQRVAIRDGRLVLLPGEAEQEVAAQMPVHEPEGLPIEPVEEITVKGIAGNEGFVSPEELQSAGTLVDATDDRILLGYQDQVFLKIDDPDLQAGDFYSLVEVGEKIKHPVSNEVLGHRVSYLGEVEITDISPSVATGVIRRVVKEITRGALVIPVKPANREIVLKKAAAPLLGHVIANSREKIALSQHDVIYLDLGAADGLEAGNMVYLSRPRQTTHRVLPDHDVELPDELLGAAVVLSTQPQTATALILKSVNPIYAGDRVATAVE
jgi:hypothetical protein